MNLKSLKLKCQNFYLAMYCGSDYASTFGKGPSFRLANNSDVNSHSFSLLGYTSNVYRHILIMLIYHQKQSHF